MCCRQVTTNGQSQRVSQFHKEHYIQYRYLKTFIDTPTSCVLRPGEEVKKKRNITQDLKIGDVVIGAESCMAVEEPTSKRAKFSDSSYSSDLNPHVSTWASATIRNLNIFDDDDLGKSGNGTKKDSKKLKPNKNAKHLLR